MQSERARGSSCLSTARECRLLRRDNVDSAEDESVLVTSLLTVSDVSVEMEKLLRLTEDRISVSSLDFCLQPQCCDSVRSGSMSKLDPSALSCILGFNYLISRRVKFCLHGPAQAEIKASGASVVIESTRALLLHPLSFLKYK